MRKTLGVWKTTILGGLFFLLPFAVVVFLIGQLSAIIAPVAAEIHRRLPEGTSISFGVASLATVLAILLLLVLCYLAGMVARSAFAAQFAERIEKNVRLLFPRYAILKNQIASNLGGHAGEATLRPVAVRVHDGVRLGFETERDAGGLVTVYLPGAPDPWSGHLLHVEAERIEPLDVSFGDAAAVCESLGQGAGKLLSASKRPELE